MWVRHHSTHAFATSVRSGCTGAAEDRGAGDKGDMQKLLQVSDERDAEQLHPQLYHSESWTGASSLQRHGSSSSELASSEQGQDTPKQDLSQEQGNFGFDS